MNNTNCVVYDDGAVDLIDEYCRLLHTSHRESIKPYLEEVRDYDLDEYYYIGDFV